MSFLQCLDFFNTKINLNYSNSKEIKSPFGGLVSLVCLISLGIFFIDFGINFFDRSNPNFLQVKENSQNFSKVVVNNKNFYLVFSLEDMKANSVRDSGLFWIEAEYFLYEKNSEGNWEIKV